jgi:hypothetical protein
MKKPHQVSKFTPPDFGVDRISITDDDSKMSEFVNDILINMGITTGGRSKYKSKTNATKTPVHDVMVIQLHVLM